ncbi:tetratricopeptide repeat protein [Wenzhouxiangella sp. XN79A]|uniref:tetratricopeptide repeat protein n=1 Tax=Wenzhouxiangella sp. XN79A TaxID=2724193 RepID=UPI00144AEC72|nr:tetratricopeptide repeat protein [Wenzhouxiangella sp. XN79A]NKI35062.1 tetratricopeptide repeat protein [Wenzhouxiangella sp. XN79A]
MIRTNSSLTLAAALTAAFAASLAAPTAVFAQAEGTVTCGVEREVDPGLLSEPVYRRLNDIFEKFGEDLFAEAYNDLAEMRERRLSDYEKASVEQAMGFAAAQQEDYQRAIRHFNEAIRINSMPNDQHFEMILQVAQLYNAIEQYDEALEQLDLWFCVSTEDAKKQADVWLLKANLHMQRDEFRQALESIDTAIELREDPPESWYRVKLGMHMELEEWPPAVDVLKILIAMNPDRKAYWIQLSGIQIELDNEEEAMAALRLAWRKGLLDKGSEFIQLAGLLQELDSPRQAASVLQDGLERGIVDATTQNWEMTAGAWYEAREMDQALAAYDRAGELSDSGKIDFQRASILVNREDWDEALAAANRALEKGDLTDSQAGNAHILVGMSHFNLGDYDEAEQAFNRASDYGRLRAAAQEWINHINQTRQRIASR